jgi:hypothetical protein
MSTREFAVCISGLSDTSQFLRVLADEPTQADTPEAIASVFGSFLGGPATTE